MSKTGAEGWPSLNAPILVAAFEGWNDAGDAASGAIEHLELVWDATPLTELDPDDYYDFQVNRPTVSLVDGVTRRITWPTTRFSYCRPPGADFDLVIVHGIEPNMRWRQFCRELLGVIRDLDVGLVVTLGALLSDTPHTRTAQVTGSAYDAEAAARYGLDRSRYEGPPASSASSRTPASVAGIPAISFWAGVPHYVAQPPNPKATLALLHSLEEVLDFPVPIEELPAQADEWQKPSTRWPPRTRRSPSTSATSKSATTRSTRPRCTRRAVTRSLPSSNGTCAAATRRRSRLALRPDWGFRHWRARRVPGGLVTSVEHSGWLVWWRTRGWE